MKGLEMMTVLTAYYNRQVTTIETWANVYRVKIAGIGFRFVSKKMVEQLLNVSPMIKTFKIMMQNLKTYGRNLLNKYSDFVIMSENGNAYHANDLNPTHDEIGRVKYWLEIDKSDTVETVIGKSKSTLSTLLQINLKR